MKKECCNFKVAETEKGFCIEIEGENIKEKCKQMFENCCTVEKKEDSGKSCC